MKETAIQFMSDELKGEDVIRRSTRIGDLINVFADEPGRAAIHQHQLVYEVEAYFPVNEGTLGGLFFGITKIYPGQVGNEYFMTRGHFHALPDRSEYYWGINGEGVLLLMDRTGKTWAERMGPNSLHYIPAHTAHRVANTGADLLSFGACWPADAGHNYQEITDKGFSARLLNVSGQPRLVAEG